MVFFYTLSIKTDILMTSMQSIVHQLHEFGMLAKTPRSGFAFLGSGQQSVAEHSHRVIFIAYALASLISEPPIDLSKLLLMSLLHDFPEARTGDLNYVNKQYVEAKEDLIIDDLKNSTPLGKQMAAILEEYHNNVSIESQIVHDADQLELMLVLKELHEMGNERAMEWFAKAQQRLTLNPSKTLAKTILTTPSDEWWKSLHE